MKDRLYPYPDDGQEYLYPYPEDGQEYLKQTYGFKKYSNRHLDVLVEKGIYPRPIQVSPRRRGNPKTDLDAYAHKIFKNKAT
jgi:hypothetical protein